MRSAATVALLTGFALIVLLGLFGPMSALGQTAPTDGSAPGSAVAGDAIAAGATAEGFHIGFEAPESIRVPFVAHEPFGFDPSTPLRFLEQSAAGATRLREAAAEFLHAPSGETAIAFAPIVLALLCALGLVLVDVRLRRMAAGWAEAASVALGARPAWVIEAGRAGIAIGAGVAVPLGAVAVALLPQDPPAVLRAIANIAAYVAGYRAAVAVTLELLDGRFLPVEPAAAARLRGAALRTFRVVLWVGVVMHTIAVLDFSPDVQALARTLFRGSMTLLSLTFLRLQGPLLAMLPAEGSAGYVRFRRALSTVLRWVLVASTALLGLWTAGFERAARTMLMRSWALVGLLVGGMLIKRWLDTRIRGLRDDDPTLQTALLRLGDGLARVVTYIAFGLLVLEVLGLLGPLTALVDSLRVVVGSTPVSLLDLLGALTTVALTILVARLIRTLLEHLVYPVVEFDEGAAYAANTALSYFMVVVSIGIALIQLGINFSALAVFAGALGVGIGIGLQDFARNLISGFILLFGRSIEKGDLISVPHEEAGYVQSITARAVKLKTRDNTELMIPTAVILTTPVTNWTHSDPYVRLHVPVGVSYGSDPEEVRAALLEAADRFELNARTRPADVWLVGFGPSSLDFELLLWFDARIATPEAVRGKLLFLVWQALKERSIEIPFPQRDLHVRSVALGGHLERLLGVAPSHDTGDTTTTAGRGA